MRDLTPEQRAALMAQLGYAPTSQQTQPILSGLAKSPGEKRTETFQNLGNRMGNESWQQNLGQIAAMRAQNPAQSPVPVGTPTMRRVEHDEGTRRWDKQFEADEKYRAQQLALAKLSGQGEPDKLQAAYSGVPAMVDELMKSGAPGGSVYDMSQDDAPLVQSTALKLRHGTAPLSAEEAAKEAVRRITLGFGAEGISYKDYKDLVDLAYRAAQISPPKEESVKSMYDNTLYEGQMDYLIKLRQTDPAKFEDLMRQKIEGNSGGW